MGGTEVEADYDRFCNTKYTKQCVASWRTKKCNCQVEPDTGISLAEGPFCSECSKSCSDPDNGVYGTCDYANNKLICNCNKNEKAKAFYFEKGCDSDGENNDNNNNYYSTGITAVQPFDLETNTY